jgi:predicted metal-dependent phosphoesterase TrpH
MIRAEFHCHTNRSHDGFTTEAELAAACLARGINVVTITEHDVFLERSFSELAAAQVRVVNGCEFTCEKGTHIIGLFLQRDLRLTGRPAEEIVEEIRRRDGVVYLPHPFKPVTGYFTQYRPGPLLDQVDMMELHNGGFAGDPNVGRIREIAARHDIRLVAGSDSHAAAHVGHFVCEYDSDGNPDLKQLFLTHDPRLLVDESRIRAPRELNWIQRRAIYQSLILRVPKSVKQPIKALFSRSRAPSGAPTRAAYREIG